MLNTELYTVVSRYKYKVRMGGVKTLFPASWVPELEVGKAYYLLTDDNVIISFMEFNA